MANSPRLTLWKTLWLTNNVMPGYLCTIRNLFKRLTEIGAKIITKSHFCIFQCFLKPLWLEHLYSHWSHLFIYFLKTEISVSSKRLDCSIHNHTDYIYLLFYILNVPSKDQVWSNNNNNGHICFSHVFWMYLQMACHLLELRHPPCPPSSINSSNTTSTLSS